MKTQTNPNLAQPRNVVANAPFGGRDVKMSKRSILRMLSGTLALLCAAQMFVACQPKSGDRSGTPPADASVLGGAGTGDTAGGDGVKSKVFEAFAVDVTKTPEWINHIAPIGHHLEELTSTTTTITDDKEMLAGFARRKTWFIAPVALEQIEKKNLGVAFIRDPIQQLALQDNKSVWIDATLYYANTKQVCDGGTPEKCERVDTTESAERERATLQMHEVVVSLYLLKFMPWKEFCFALGGQADSCVLTNMPKSLNKFEPPRPLVEEDYKQIRAMTDYMMNQARFTKDANEFLIQGIRHGFDPRLFNLKKRGNAAGSNVKLGERIPINLADQSKSLAQSEVLGRMPRVCARLPMDDIKAVCGVHTELVETPGVSTFLKMTFDLNFNGRSQRYVAYRVVGATDPESSLYRYPRSLDYTETALFHTFGYAMPEGSSLAVGQDFYQINVGYAEDRQTVIEIALAPRRVTGVKAIGQTESHGYVGDTFDVTYGIPQDRNVKRVHIGSEADLEEAQNFAGYTMQSMSQTEKLTINPRRGTLPKSK